MPVVDIRLVAWCKATRDDQCERDERNQTEIGERTVERYTSDQSRKRVVVRSRRSADDDDCTYGQGSGVEVRSDCPGIGDGWLCGSTRESQDGRFTQIPWISREAASLHMSR